MDTSLLVWLIAIVVLIVAEIATVQLVAIWPAIGCIAALIAALFGQSLAIQILLFFVVSILLLVFTRPLVHRLIRTPLVTSTNADRIIGQEAIVTEDIDNIAGKGTIIISGIVWSARSENGQPIATGQKVLIQQIKGVKVIVAPL